MNSYEQHGDSRQKIKFVFFAFEFYIYISKKIQRPFTSFNERVSQLLIAIYLIPKRDASSLIAHDSKIVKRFDVALSSRGSIFPGPEKFENRYPQLCLIRRKQGIKPATGRLFTEEVPFRNGADQY